MAGDKDRSEILVGNWTRCGDIAVRSQEQVGKFHSIIHSTGSLKESGHGDDIGKN